MNDLVGTITDRLQSDQDRDSCVASRPPPAPPARPPRILVVDEDAGLRHLGCSYLANAGYNVDTADDGEAAWAALCSSSYDLLLTGQVMPRLRGLDLVARMRAAGLTLPVIIHSGCPDVGEASDYPNLALAAVLHKPSGLREVRGAVARVLCAQPINDWNPMRTAKEEA